MVGVGGLLPVVLKRLPEVALVRLPPLRRVRVQGGVRGGEVGKLLGPLGRSWEMNWLIILANLRMKTCSPWSHSQSILPVNVSPATPFSSCLAASLASSWFPAVPCWPTLAMNCSNSSTAKTGASSSTGTSASKQCQVRFPWILYFKRTGPV